jgi:hypothetical protein
MFETGEDSSTAQCTARRRKWHNPCRRLLSSTSVEDGAESVVISVCIVNKFKVRNLVIIEVMGDDPHCVLTIYWVTRIE